MTKFSRNLLRTARKPQQIAGIRKKSIPQSISMHRVLSSYFQLRHLCFWPRACVADNGGVIKRHLFWREPFFRAKQSKVSGCFAQNFLISGYDLTKTGNTIMCRTSRSILWRDFLCLNVGPHIVIRSKTVFVFLTSLTKSMLLQPFPRQCSSFECNSCNNYTKLKI